MNNDGTVSHEYDEGVIKYSNGVLEEGSRINLLLNGKVYFKWHSENREISETFNNNRHGPAVIYDFDGEVSKEYYSNGEEIFLR